mgnify:CR=1 FL=1
MTLTPWILPAPRLSGDDRDRMLALMTSHFDGLTPAAFHRDLDEKQWVILLRDPEGAIGGFSTVQTLELNLDGEPHRFLFSGDTIVAPEHWNQPVLAGAFGHLMLRLGQERPKVPFHWFLITKGYRTYRFLPLNFRTFHPRHDAPTPPEVQHRLEAVGRAKFPMDFDPESGLIRASAGKERLCPALCAIPEGRSQDPHVRYFLQRNPDFALGNELACLTDLTEANLTPLAWRQIQRTEPVWGTS